MAAEVVIVLKGRPLAKKRPRFARTAGGHVVTYHDQANDESKVAWEIKRQWGREPLTGPVGMRVCFGMPIPKGASKKDVAAMLAGGIPHIKKPDLDNMLKFVKDCCNRAVWADDCQVVSVSACKIYAGEPFTSVAIWED